jgi:hypothetical protein
MGDLVLLFRFSSGGIARAWSTENFTLTLGICHGWAAGRRDRTGWSAKLLCRFGRWSRRVVWSSERVTSDRLYGAPTVKNEK